MGIESGCHKDKNLRRTDRSYNGSYDIVVQAFEEKLAITITTVSGVKRSGIPGTGVEVQFFKAEKSRFDKRICIKPLLITAIDLGKIYSICGC